MIRDFWAPDQLAARIEQDQRDAREIAAGIECPDPDCRAALGQPCFHEGERSTHPARAIAFYDARLWARRWAEIERQMA